MVKKKLFFLILIIGLVVLIMPTVAAALQNVPEFKFCEDPRILRAFKAGGILIYIIKILIPLIIIIMGSIDFGKALVSGDDKDISLSTQKMLKRFIAGIIIFFIPTLVSVILNMIEGATDFESKFSDCHNCLLTPFSDTCK